VVLSAKVTKKVEELSELLEDEDLEVIWHALPERDR